MNNKIKIIMLMIDGFGVPKEGWNKSIFSEYCAKEFTDLLINYSISIDATLDIPGIPQSATGQTALFTGINGAKSVGRHLPGFPGPTLKKIIEKQNIFKTLQSNGKKVSFANAYIKYSLEKIVNSRFCSVTSYMVNNSIHKVYNKEALIQNHAVYHDITRKTVSPKEEVPIVKPEEAGKHLITTSHNFDFTLFEYFLTDIAGHRPKKVSLPIVLEELSNFITTIKLNLSEDTLLIISSDHGNCEDPSTLLHTCNNVPLIVYGSDACLKKVLIKLSPEKFANQEIYPVPIKKLLKKCASDEAKSIADVYNFIVKTLC